MEAAENRHPLARILLGLSALTVAIIGGTALFHVQDRHAVSHVAGVWLALAQYAREGVLFPPVFDDGYFGGTRYMPLGVLYHAGFAALLDDPMLGGKLGSLLAAAALAVTSYLAVRGAGASRSVAAGLAATVLASDPGFEAAHSVRGDALPLALQLAALTLALRARAADAGGGRGRSAGLDLAAVLLGLAPLAKTTALWAGAAIGLDLLRRDRRAGLRFVLIGAATLLAGLGLAHYASGGRMLESLGQFGGVGGPSASWKKSPTRLNRMLMDSAPTTWMLLPWAIAAAGRSRGPARLALGLCLLVLLVVFADAGTFQNHLLDLAAAVAVLVGAAWVTWTPELRRAAALCVAVGLGGSLVRFGGPELSRVGREVGGKLEAEDDLAVLEAALQGARTILSEDPGLPVRRGQRPVVLDPYIMGRIAERRPELAERLAGRVRAREFDRIVLLVPLVAGDPWYDAHFGWAVAGAMLEAYEPDRSVAGYQVLRPRPVVGAVPAAPTRTATGTDPPLL